MTHSWFLRYKFTKQSGHTWCWWYTAEVRFVKVSPPWRNLKKIAYDLINIFAHASLLFARVYLRLLAFSSFHLLTCYFLITYLTIFLLVLSFLICFSCGIVMKLFMVILTLMIAESSKSAAHLSKSTARLSDYLKFTRRLQISSRSNFYIAINSSVLQILYQFLGTRVVMLIGWILYCIHTY